MAIGFEPTLSTLVLSRGTAFTYTFFTRPSVNFAEGTTASIVFTDSAGGVIGIFTGDVQLDRIVFEQDNTDVIPHGANFEFLVSMTDGVVFKPQYGTVVRKEARFPLSTVVDPDNTSVQYTANFLGSYIGPKWLPMGGTGSLEVHGTTPPTMGPKYSFFSSAAARWLWPMNMDSVTINVTVQNHGAGKMNVIVCADSQMSQYLGIQFESGISNNRVWVIKSGGGPVTWTQIGTSVANTVANNDNYQIKYNELSKTIALYKGTSLTPLIQWTDSGDDIIHGEGFRYTGLSWNSSLFAPGVEPSAWEAKDGV